jgi:nicotinate-nucleotide adenylyltransferase
MHKKTLCLGGSFNPIHHGHLICARTIAETCGFSNVLLIPSANPPHKPLATDLADPAHRLHMCRLAIQTNEPNSEVQFDVSDIEIARSGQPSYTIDTVRQLKRQGWERVHWLIGADMLNYLPNWHEAAALLREVDFLIMARPGVPMNWNSLPPEFSSLQKHIIPAPLIDISSSEIRRRLKAGLPINYLTPPTVVDYITKHKLYGAQANAENRG